MPSMIAPQIFYHYLILQHAQLIERTDVWVRIWLAMAPNNNLYYFIGYAGWAVLALFLGLAAIAYEDPLPFHGGDFSQLKRLWVFNAEVCARVP